MELTKCAEYVAHKLFKIYKDSLKSGNSKNEAKMFNGAREVHNFFYELSFEDFLESIRELSRNNHVNVSWASNIFAALELESKMIYDFENRFKNNAYKLLDIIYKLRKIVLWS